MSGATFDWSESYPLHLTPTALAASPVAGLSCPWPIASPPLLSRLCAACFSLVGSNQVFVQTTCTVAPGWVVWAPSAAALISRVTSGVGHGATKPVLPCVRAAPRA